MKEPLSSNISTRSKSRIVSFKRSYTRSKNSFEPKRKRCERCSVTGNAKSTRSIIRSLTCKQRVLRSSRSWRGRSSAWKIITWPRSRTKSTQNYSKSSRQLRKTMRCSSWSSCSTRGRSIDASNKRKESSWKRSSAKKSLTRHCGGLASTPLISLDRPHPLNESLGRALISSRSAQTRQPSTCNPRPCLKMAKSPWRHSPPRQQATINQNHSVQPSPTTSKTRPTARPPLPPAQLPLPQKPSQPQMQPPCHLSNPEAKTKVQPLDLNKCSTIDNFRNSFKAAQEKQEQITLLRLKRYRLWLEILCRQQMHPRPSMSRILFSWSQLLWDSSETESCINRYNHTVQEKMRVE